MKRVSDKVAGMKKEESYELHNYIHKKAFRPGSSGPGANLHSGYCTCIAIDLPGKWTCKHLWSVGEHCICCAKEALGRGYSNRQALACLLHDASECYMSDVPRPLKQEMPRYREVEEQLLQVIYKKFLGSSLTDEEAQRLKEIDDDLLWYDLEVLLEEKQPGDAPKLHFELDYTVRPFVEVEQEYLEMFQKLSES